MYIIWYRLCIDYFFSWYLLDNLLDLNRIELTEYIQKFGHKPFRAKQLLKWIYHFGERDFSQMTESRQAPKLPLPWAAFVAFRQSGVWNSVFLRVEGVFIFFGFFLIFGVYYSLQRELKNRRVLLCFHLQKSSEEIPTHFFQSFNRVFASKLSYWKLSFLAATQR